MSRTLIEQEGIDTVKRYIRKNGYMIPYLDENDKYPMWDGFINVYMKNIININENNVFWDYRLPVQVKATRLKEEDDFPPIAHFQVPISHLISYYTDGGLVYFYVLIKNNVSQIYCNYLTKIKIKQIIDDASDINSKSITLEKITEDPLEFRRHLRVVQLQRQHNVINLDEIDLNNVTTLTLIVDKENVEEDKIVSLVRNKVNILVNMKGLKESLYAIGEPTRVQLIKSDDVDVSVNGKIYYNKMPRKAKDDGVYLYFGESTFMRLPLEDQTNAKVYLEYKTKGSSLDIVINDLEFIINLVETQKIKLGNATLELDDLSQSAVSLKSFKNELSFWKNVKNLFELLHIRGELNPTTLDNKDYDNLNALIKSFLYDEPVYNSLIQEQLYDVEVGGFHICVYAKKDKENYYKLCDIYKIVHSCYVDENKLYRDSSPLSFIFCMERLPSNLYLDNIEREYGKYQEYNDRLSEIATLDLLNMLNHYDKNNDDYILDAALKLSSWLLKQKKLSAEERIVFKLNYYQTLSRSKNKLSSDDIEELIKMRIKDDGCNFARYLLVGNKEKAISYFNKLDDNQKTILKSQPIYHFMNI